MVNRLRRAKRAVSHRLLRAYLRTHLRAECCLAQHKELLGWLLLFAVIGVLNADLALAQAPGGGGGGGGGGAGGGGYSGAKYGKVCQTLLQLLEQDLGSLLTALAGLGAIVASAMGGFKMAWSLIVVSVGSFVLKHYQELWFAQCS